MHHTCTIETALGAVSITWARDRVIKGIQLPGGVETGGKCIPLPAWLEGVKQAVQCYFRGQPVDFQSVCSYFKTIKGLPALDATPLTEFQRAVYGAVSAIGYGERRSYGEIARAVGRPKAARAVGGAMAANPFPLIVPCHRILAADGLGGFSGGCGVQLKRQMLALEGILVS